ncbi:MAG: hypothetical protein FWE03_06515, partial [Firmicutes bacterium]|nr:hypothetical protein [Bacillota bacterium]
LVFLAQEVNVGNTYLAWSNFVLVNDIYLNDLSDLWMMLMLENWELFVSSWQQAINLVEYYGLNIWTPIGNQDNPFMGLFDGGGFSIRGMVSVGAYSQGLFGHMFGGTIENLRIEDSFVVGGENTGSVVGSMMWGSVINVHSDTVIRVTANNTGGLVGLMYFSSVAGSSNSGNIYANNFINDGSVLAADYIGGIAGFIMHSAISESRNYGYIFSCCSNWNVNFIGGILGAMEFSLVINSANMGMLMVGGEAVGGIVGLIYSHSVVVNNYNLGHIITGSGWVGGIVGMSLFDNVQIINNFNAGVVCYFNAGSIAGFISNWWNGLVVSNNYGNSNLFMMWGFSQNYIFNCNDNLLSALNAFMSTNGWVNNWGWVGHPTMGLHMLAGWEIDASTGLPKHILNNFYFGANINNNLMKLNMPHRLLFKYSDMAILQVRLDVLLLQRQYVMVHIDYIMLYMWYDA